MKYLLLLFFSVVVSAQEPCSIQLSPPMPPSPREFQSKLKTSSDAMKVLLEWETIETADGYLVTVCNPDTGIYFPLAEVTGEAFYITAFERPGEHWFRVRAYVDVNEYSRVMNNGVWQRVILKEVSSEQTTSPSETTEKSNVPVEQEISQNVERGEFPDIYLLSQQLPQVGNAGTFYDSRFPEVANPFISKSGKPLLTDENISKAFARMQERKQAVLAGTPVALTRSAGQPFKPALPQKKSENTNAFQEANGRQELIAKTSGDKIEDLAATNAANSVLNTESVSRNPVSKKKWYKKYPWVKYVLMGLCLLLIFGLVKSSREDS
jgi:hypothetical protein